MGLSYPVSNNGMAPLEYGEGAPRIGVKTIPLDTATTDKAFEIGGNVLWVPTASTLDAAVSIKYQDQLNDPITFQQGNFLAGPSFSRLYISWEAQAGESITLLYAVDSPKNPFRIENATASFTGVSVTGTVDCEAVNYANDKLISASRVTLSTTAATLLRVSENPHGTYGYRVQILIQNEYTNTYPIRVDKASVTPTLGQIVQPGETLVLDTSDEVYACNMTSSTQYVNVTLIYRSV